MPNIKNYEDFLSANDIAISGIEFILDKEGNVWTYDVNVNTNYNSSAELKAGQFAYKEIANYLFSLSKNYNNLIAGKKSYIFKTHYI